MFDKYAIKQQWNVSMDYPLNLDNPETLNEKLQWLKLHDHNPLYTILVDKQAVKAWIAEQFGEEYIIPTLKLYSSPSQLDINNLPAQFVLKCNHDSGSVIVCENNNSFDVEDARQKLGKALEKNWYYVGREWCYKNIKKRFIMVEPYLTDSNGNAPNDYKLHFINGKLVFIYVSYDRASCNIISTYA